MYLSPLKTVKRNLLLKCVIVSLVTFIPWSKYLPKVYCISQNINERTFISKNEENAKRFSIRCFSLLVNKLLLDRKKLTRKLEAQINLVWLIFNPFAELLRYVCLHHLTFFKEPTTPTETSIESLDIKNSDTGVFL